jgi:hypothetical protein
VASGKARAPVRAWVKVKVRVKVKVLDPGMELHRVWATVKDSPVIRAKARATRQTRFRSYLERHRRRSQRA